MKAKIFAVEAAVLLALLILNTPISVAQQDVEPGIDGLLDLQTNIDNIIGLIRYSIYSLADWIKE